MANRPKRPRDANQLAKMIVDIATGQIPKDAPAAPENERAIRTGKQGGHARALLLSKAMRLSIARKAARARWGAKKRA